MKNHLRWFYVVEKMHESGGSILWQCHCCAPFSLSAANVMMTFFIFFLSFSFKWRENRERKFNDPSASSSWTENLFFCSAFLKDLSRLFWWLYKKFINSNAQSYFCFIISEIILFTLIICVEEKENFFERKKNLYVDDTEKALHLLMIDLSSRLFDKFQNVELKIYY